jgi:hypothetical protein
MVDEIVMLVGVWVGIIVWVGVRVGVVWVGVGRCRCKGSVIVWVGEIVK